VSAWKAKAEALEEEVADLQYTLEHVQAVTAGCSSIPVEWLDVGGIRVGLSATGDAVRVEFPDTLTGMYGWDAE
jgi:hypothetical protein